MPMPLIPDLAVFQRKLATLPLATYQAGETVLSAASTTGRLLILKEGAVAVVKEGVEIARVTEPGAVFGELSVLLDQPHTADVRALEASQFHVTDAATILRIDPIALLYVATVLAQRLDSANRGLLELKRQVQAGEPRSVIGNNEERGSARNDRLTQSRSAFAEKPPAVSAAGGVRCRKSESPGQGSRVLPGALSSFGPPWFGGPAQSPLPPDPNRHQNSVIALIAVRDWCRCIEALRSRKLCGHCARKGKRLWRLAYATFSAIRLRTALSSTLCITIL